jgi:hypothetical protein
VSGHSLGGALAALAAVYINHEVQGNQHAVNLSLFTIGEPRVGDRDFADYIDRYVCLLFFYFALLFFLIHYPYKLNSICIFIYVKFTATKMRKSRSPGKFNSFKKNI